MTLLEIAKEDTSLRTYQTQSKAEIYKAWESSPSVMFQMPTGTGKTRLFVSIIKDTQRCAHENGERYGVLVLAHRVELIEQISDTLGRKYNIAHGIIKSGFDENQRFPVQVASVQSLSKRLANWTDKSFSYIIIDEAHHATAQTYRKIIKSFPYAKVLGVTATPYRLSGESFRDLFGRLITSQTVSKFIEQGYLSEYSYYSILPDSITQHLIDDIDDFGADGDYDEKALIEAFDKDYIRAGLVEAYQEHAEGKKGIIYTINRAHNEHVKEAFEQIGLKVVTIDGKTPAKERKKLVSDFKSGKIDIICNVNIFSEGFDCPDIEFIQLARPTMSLSMYLQQVGRGLRPSEGKEEAVIIDNVGLYNRFGLPSANRQWKRHFEGRANAKVGKPKKNKKKATVHRDYDFSEGDEHLELIHSSIDETRIPPVQVQAQEQLELEAALSSAEEFPIGIKGKIEYLDHLETLKTIRNRTDLKPEQKKELLSFDSSIRKLGDHIQGVIHYDNINEWKESVEEDVTNYFEIDDCEQMNKYYNLLYNTVRFKYKGHWGIGVKLMSDWATRRLFLAGRCSLEQFFDLQLEPEFDEIGIPDSDEHFVCYKDGFAGLLDGNDMTQILPFEYDSITTLSNDLFIVQKQGRFGVIKNNEILLNYAYDDILGHPFRDISSYHYTAVEQNNRWGLCDLHNLPISIQWLFEPILPIAENLFLAKGPKGSCGIVNSSGELQFPYFAPAAVITDNPTLPVYLEYGQTLYITRDGNFVTKEDELYKEDIGKLKAVKAFSFSTEQQKTNTKKKAKEQAKEKETGIPGNNPNTNEGMPKEHKPQPALPKIEDGFHVVSKRRIFGNEIKIVSNNKVSKFYINGIVNNDAVFGGIQYLAQDYFKFTRNGEQWGVLKITTDGTIKIIRNDDFNKISYYMGSSYILLEKEGNKPRILFI